MLVSDGRGLRYPPGPKPNFLIGNMPLIGKDPLGAYAQWAAEYGDIFHYRFLWNHIYLLNRPEYIEYVLVQNPRIFIKDQTTRNSRWLLGNGLLTSEGDLWIRQRRLIQPAFHRDRIAEYAATMTGYTQEMLEHWSDGMPIGIHGEMMELTLKIVVKCLCSQDSEETRTIARSHDLVIGQTSGIRLLLPPITHRLPLPGMRAFRRAADDLNAAVAKIVARRRQTQDNSGDDLLSMLMTAYDEDGSGMDDQQIRDEVMTFFLAGHETTALAMTWTLYLLSRNPDAENRLHEELDRVLGGRVPGLADLPSLVWTDAVIKESLRLYPPAWCIARTATKDFEIGGYTIPAGATIGLSQWVLHHDPRYFPEPDRFDPARWTKERADKLPRFAYFPFGGGQRLCIGASFATMEAVLLLATIAQRFRVRVDPAYTVQPVPGFTLRPNNEIPAVLSARTQAVN